MAADSIKKTEFITPTGLFEFRVIPYGLTNAPAVFQRLMQNMLRGLNPPGGISFVLVYIDDVLMFSRTPEEHQHISRVLARLQEAGLKLKPSKCHFKCQRVEYLGHLITPQGLLPNPKKVSAVTNFPLQSQSRILCLWIILSTIHREFREDCGSTASADRRTDSPRRTASTAFAMLTSSQFLYFPP